jgi:hypothetical protein
MRKIKVSFWILGVVFGLAISQSETASGCAFCKMAALKNAPAVRTPTSSGNKNSGGGGEEVASVSKSVLTDPKDYFKDSVPTEVVDPSRGKNRIPGASGITEVQTFTE